MRKVLIAAVGLFASAALFADTPSREDKAAFEKVCGACHTSGMVSDIRSEPEWVDTVAEMVKIGAKGTDEELERVMRYLRQTLTKVNVNTATAAEMAPVLDITVSAAQALVKRRTEKGNFKTLEELKQVPGVDAAKLEARRNRVFF